jgi:hypothetical protein
MGSGDGEDLESLLNKYLESIHSSIDIKLSRLSGEPAYVMEVLVGPVRLRVGFIDASGQTLQQVLGKALALKNEHSLDKIIVVASKGLTHEAESQSLNLDWLEIVSLEEFERTVSSIKPVVRRQEAISGIAEFHIKPRINSEEGLMRLAERHRGRIIRKGDIIGSRIAFLPLYCTLVHVHTIDYTTDYLESEHVRMCFETITGSLVTYEDGIRPATFWQRIGELGEELVKLVHRIADLGEASMSELKEEFRFSIDLEAAIDVLIEKGLIEPRAPDTYSLASLPTSRIRDVFERLEPHLVEGKPGCGMVLRQYSKPEKIKSIVEPYGSIKEERLVYYPLHIIIYTKRAGNRKIDIAITVDALTGSRLGELEELLAESPAVVDIDYIVDRVAEEGGLEVCKG